MENNEVVTEVVKAAAGSGMNTLQMAGVAGAGAVVGALLTFGGEWLWEKVSNAWKNHKAKKAEVNNDTVVEIGSISKK